MATLNGYHLDDTPTGTPQPTFLAAGASFSRKRKPVECDVCHQIYSTKHSMLLHRQSQHEHLRHTCEYCDRSFSYKYDLYTHMTKAHPEVEGLGANCEVCGVLTHFAVLEGHQKKCGRKVVKQNGGG
ncbi:Krueppel homolog 1-like [Paramacrobiotus metropolitanus]|uniref:Krueppel homolog 1-like n=1 Tax=Paramacrobiotus metropolitanus TaxID=2943436 RepID=UPI0024458D71|nr:Krueppel homolog 1-like [Paramacrobiotus metropolitanus]XP_055354164.1 Krueppel homolog 1-like [Paramacrobiotus metropolitanus]